MKFQFYARSENKEVDGTANSVVEAKDKIRKALSGEKIDWDNDVTIIEVRE